MFTRKSLRLLEAAFKHTSPLQTMMAADVHVNRAARLLPPTGSVHFDTPYFRRRGELAGRAADKAANLMNRAERQDREYLALAKKIKRPKSANSRENLGKTPK